MLWVGKVVVLNRETIVEQIQVFRQVVGLLDGIGCFVSVFLLLLVGF